MGEAAAADTAEAVAGVAVGTGEGIAAVCIDCICGVPCCPGIVEIGDAGGSAWGTSTAEGTAAPVVIVAGRFGGCIKVASGPSIVATSGGGALDVDGVAGAAAADVAASGDTIALRLFRLKLEACCERRSSRNSS